MLESGPIEPQAQRYPSRQMTRVSKNSLFPQLEPFAKLRNWIAFSKFQLSYGSFFDAIHKDAVEIGFCEVSSLANF